jgi:hypothetical protein
MRSTKRSFVSLLTALSFVVLAVTGVLAFARPFSIQVVGLHALMGFVFIGLIALHVINNTSHLNRYLRSKTLWTTSSIAIGLTALFLWQPAPIKSVLGLSQNLGPALDRFEVTGQGLTYRYNSSPNYRMALNVRAGLEFNTSAPPNVAIWLENASFYHIKTLHETGGRAALPYWDFKMHGWEEAKRKAVKPGKGLAEELGVDAISGATQNSSFDPADYILPSDPDNPMPYRLLIEIDQADDNQASLVYAVEIDNADPHTFQLLELMGYPKREADDQDGKEVWALYYVDENFTTALKLIDSALLTIDRGL